MKGYVEYNKLFLIVTETYRQMNIFNLNIYNPTPKKKNYKKYHV